MISSSYLSGKYFQSLTPKTTPKTPSLYWGNPWYKGKKKKHTLSWSITSVGQNPSSRIHFKLQFKPLRHEIGIDRQVSSEIHHLILKTTGKGRQNGRGRSRKRTSQRPSFPDQLIHENQCHVPTPLLVPTFFPFLLFPLPRPLVPSLLLSPACCFSFCWKGSEKAVKTRLGETASHKTGRRNSPLCSPRKTSLNFLNGFPNSPDMDIVLSCVMR